MTATSALAAGTIQIAGSIAPNNNNPHQGCTVFVEFFGFDAGAHSATINFTSQGGPGAGTVIPSTPASGAGNPFTFNVAPPGGGGTATFNDAQAYELDPAAAGLLPGGGGGYMVDVDVTVNTGEAGQKVIRVEGCNDDLAVDKSGPATGTVNAPGGGLYTLAVSNVGADSAPAPITLTDAIPAGETINTATGSGWTCSGPGGSALPLVGPSTLTCIRGSALASGATAPTVNVNVTWTATGTLRDTAVVTSSRTDLFPTNNTDFVDTVVGPAVVLRPDVVVDKSGPGSAVQGSTGNSYTLDASNAGTATAATGAFTLTDTLPAGETATAVAQGVGGVAYTSCLITGGGSTVTCDHPGLAIGAAASQVTVTVTIGAAVAPGTVLRNNVAVPTLNNESVTGNNSDFVDTTVSAAPVLRPDVIVGKSGPASAVQGSTGNLYVLSASNSGTATAPTGAFTMTDTLPAGETATAVSQAAGGVAWTSCAISGGGSTVICQHPGLAIGASASQVTVTVTIGAGVPVGTVLRDTVSVPTLGNESATANNSAFVDTTVAAVDVCTNIAGVQATVPAGYTVVGTTCTPPSVPVTSPDLSIVKAGPNSAVKPGDNVPYTLTVTNIGTGSASTVQVTDTLPAAMTFVSASGSGFTCSGTSTISCQLAGSLAPGASAVVNVVATLSSTYGSTAIANTAVVLPTDSNPGNNTDTESTAVTLPTPPVDEDLGLSKTGLEPSVSPGGVLSWSLVVTNVKGTPAAGFTVTDVLPAGLTVLSVGGTDWGCSTAGQAVTCTYTGAPLPVGSSAAFQIDAVVAADYAGTDVSNTAVVDPGGVDTTNDSATSVTPVTEVITGGGGGGVTEPTPAPEPPAEEGGGPVLPFTGTNADQLLSWGVTVLMFGLLLAIVGRRRRSA